MPIRVLWRYDSVLIERLYSKKEYINLDIHVPNNVSLKQWVIVCLFYLPFSWKIEGFPRVFIEEKVLQKIFSSFFFFSLEQIY